MARCETGHGKRKKLQGKGRSGTQRCIYGLEMLQAAGLSTRVWRMGKPVGMLGCMLPLRIVTNMEDGECNWLGRPDRSETWSDGFVVGSIPMVPFLRKASSSSRSKSEGMIAQFWVGLGKPDLHPDGVSILQHEHRKLTGCRSGVRSCPRGVYPLTVTSHMSCQPPARQRLAPGRQECVNWWFSLWLLNGKA